MSRKEQILKYTKEFEQQHKRQPFDVNEVADWLMQNDYWKPLKDFARRKCVEEVKDVLREQYITAEDGSRVRLYHSATTEKDGRQLHLWANMFDAPREHLEVGFQERRRQSLGDARQLKSDMDYVNQKRFQENPIQMSFNFDEDLAEEEAFKEMNKKKKKAA
jgi:hypothetical protein